MNQLERCWNIDEFAPVRVYVSMSNKVVDRVMHRRGSLVGWNSLRQSNSVRQYRIGVWLWFCGRRRSITA